VRGGPQGDSVPALASLTFLDQMNSRQRGCDPQIAPHDACQVELLTWLLVDVAVIIFAEQHHQFSGGAEERR
jgi:hypothetical protein